MSRKFYLAFFSLILSVSISRAHEGHNHDAPKGLQPIKGGEIKQYNADVNGGTDKKQSCFVEVVKSKTSLKIFFFDSEKKNVLAKDFELSAFAKPFSPKLGEKKAAEIPLAIEDKKNYYSTSYEKKNAHKFDLILKFKGPNYCKTDEEISFIID